MVQYPRHAIIELNEDWTVKSYSCLLCGHTSSTEKLLVEHLSAHEVKNTVTSVFTSGYFADEAEISYTASYTIEDIEGAKTFPEPSDSKEEKVNMANVYHGIKQETVMLLAADATHTIEGTRYETSQEDENTIAMPEAVEMDESSEPLKMPDGMEEEVQIVIIKQEGGDEVEIKTTESGKAQKPSVNRSEIARNHDPGGTDEPANHDPGGATVVDPGGRVDEHLTHDPGGTSMVMTTDSPPHGHGVLKPINKNQDHLGLELRKAPSPSSVKSGHSSPVPSAVPYDGDIPAQTFVCDICTAPFTTPGWLEHHMKTAHPNNPAPFKCTKCNTRFEKLHQLDVHTFQFHRNDYTYHNSDPSHPEAKRRRRAKTPPRPDIVVPIDDPEIKTQHNVPDGKLRNYVCNICGWAFKYNHHLRNHIEAVHQKLSYACHICGRQYKGKRPLKLHILSHEEEGISTNMGQCHKCLICNKAFLKRNHFENHLRAKHGAITFQCHICEQRFSKESELAVHLQKHSEAYQYACDICSHKYVTEEDLKVHKASHAKENPIGTIVVKKEITDDHDKNFDEEETQLLELEDTEADLHSILKNDVSDTIADVAVADVVSLQDFGFPVSQNKTFNLPFECVQCNSNFVDDASLKKHQKESHGDTLPHCCNICGAYFKTFMLLQKHSLRTHKAPADLRKDTPMAQIKRAMDKAEKESSREVKAAKELVDIHTASAGKNTSDGMSNVQGNPAKDELDTNSDGADEHVTGIDYNQIKPSKGCALGKGGNGDHAYTCSQCPATFRYWHQLSDHVSIHEDGGHVCSTCGKIYKTRKAMQDHSCEMLQCKVCHKVYEYKGHFLRHLKSEHNIDEI